VLAAQHLPRLGTADAVDAELERRISVGHVATVHSSGSPASRHDRLHRLRVPLELRAEGQHEPEQHDAGQPGSASAAPRRPVAAWTFTLGASGSAFIFPLDVELAGDLDHGPLRWLCLSAARQRVNERTTRSEAFGVSSSRCRQAQR
jgi:hypothetical protein